LATELMWRPPEVEDKVRDRRRAFERRANRDYAAHRLRDERCWFIEKTEHQLHEIIEVADLGRSRDASKPGPIDEPVVRERVNSKLSHYRQVRLPLSAHLTTSGVTGQSWKRQWASSCDGELKFGDVLVGVFAVDLKVELAATVVDPVAVVFDPPDHGRERVGDVVERAAVDRRRDFYGWHLHHTYVFVVRQRLVGDVEPQVHDDVAYIVVPVVVSDADPSLDAGDVQPVPYHPQPVLETGWMFSYP